MNYYSTLGVGQNASDDEIKKAYRKMAMKHHPDRGGDEAQFKKISEAYEVLSDPEKKRMVDMGVDPNAQQSAGPYGNSFRNGPFEFHFGGGHPGMDDIFAQFGFGRGGYGARPQKRNKSLNISVDLTLEDVLTGKELNAEITIPGTNKKKMININIPAGIEHGQQIRYEGMGDDSIPDIRAGDLIVNAIVHPHQIFKRDGHSLHVEKIVSVWDAILGTSIDIETLDKKTLSVTIPKGTQPGTVLSCKNEGLPVLNSRSKGNMFIHIKIDIPRNVSGEQLEKIKQLKEIWN